MWRQVFGSLGRRKPVRVGLLRSRWASCMVPGVARRPPPPAAWPRLLSTSVPPTVVVAEEEDAGSGAEPAVGGAPAQSPQRRMRKGSSHSEALAKCRDLEAMVELIHKRGVQVAKVHVVAMVKGLRRLKLVDDLVQLPRELHTLNVHAETVEHTATRIIKVIGEISGPQKAVEVVHGLVELGYSVDPVHLSQILESCRTRKDGEVVEQIMQVVSQLGLDPDQYFLNLLIKFYAQSGQTDMALKMLRLLQEQGKVDIFTYNPFITALSLRGDYKHAFEVFEELEKQGIEPTAWSCNALMRACNRGERWDITLAMYDRLKEHGRHSHPSLFIPAVKAAQILEKAGKLHEVSDDFLQWREKILVDDKATDKNRVDIVRPKHVRGVYTAIVDAFSTVRPERAIEFLTLAEEDTVRPSIQTYNFAVYACSKTENAPLAVDMLHRMQDRFGIKADDALVANVIYACAIGRAHDRAMEVFRWAKDRNILNLRGCNGIINSILRTGNTSDLPDIFTSMCANKLSITPFMIGQALKATAVYGDWDTAVAILELYKEDGGPAFRDGDAHLFLRACRGVNKYIDSPVPEPDVFARLADLLLEIDPRLGPAIAEHSRLMSSSPSSPEA